MALPKSAGEITAGFMADGEEQFEAAMNSFASPHTVGMYDPETVNVTAVDNAVYTIGVIDVTVAKKECGHIREWIGKKIRGTYRL